MPNQRRVYLLDSKNINPETIAVTFAKTSRSSKAFDDIAKELSDESSAAFHEKWVVGYGHASVAEHAVLHIAIENISRLAVECLESNRLASYTEKSSRYQEWSEESFFIPTELAGTTYKQIYVSTVKKLLKIYKKALPLLQEKLTNNVDSNSSSHELQTKCMDVCRYYLPAASFANVGVTINARELEHALRKMLSHPLAEVRQIGKEIKTISMKVLPTLVKYVDEVDYLISTRKHLNNSFIEQEKGSNKNDEWCNLISVDQGIEKKILSAALYRFSEQDYLDNSNSFEQLNKSEKTQLVNALLGNLSSHDIPIRELEYGEFLFDILMDQGAYFEFKRHRMMTQTVQKLSVKNGYAVPKIITKAGLENEYHKIMQETISAYYKLCEFDTNIASYIVPNAFNRRVLAGLNFRTALHLINLRTAPNAHFAIRRIVNRMAELIREELDLFKPYVSPKNKETWQQIEEVHFSSICS